MKRLLAIVALVVVAGAAAGSARSDTFAVFDGLLPSSAAQNTPGLLVPESFTSPPAQAQSLAVEELRPIWEAAGAAYGIPWPVLAAINKVESDFGKNMGPSSAGAVGWMQFMPSTWLSWGMDADGDGIADPWNARDAIFSAARYLAASGGGNEIDQAVFAYNHADWYVKEVLDLARVYADGGNELATTLEQLKAELAAAQEDVVRLNGALERALARQTNLLSQQADALRAIDPDDLVAERLEAEHRAASLGTAASAQRGKVADLRSAIARAEARLREARRRTQAASFSPGVGQILSAPSYHDGWAFPVGGGPSLVSVGRDHHDYPAADIAAPAGTPVYALANARVLQAWDRPEGNCGIGVTMQTEDGQTWTYCHLSYLDVKVQAGVSLPVGTAVGLVGTTGHSTGPHLHLQLQPAGSYPQEQDWFKSFGGNAFRWQGEEPETVAPVFSVVPS